jgi:uncharacterized protein YqjF (DUF2071 family)
MQTTPPSHPANPAAERAIGYQRWSDLLFVHWRLPADVVAAGVPRQLSVDTWEGDAWVGLVLFQMSGVRPWWACPVPWLSSFPETNLRTYVRFRGGDPGVWFFSLEAGNPIAVWIARRWWSLNYFWAQMQIEQRATSIRYASRRRGSDSAIGTRVAAEIETDAVPPATFRAATGTLEHFLIERYLLYTLSSDGSLLEGRVRHTPYPLCKARLVQCEENLVAAAGLPAPTTPPCHVIYSPGVSVDILPLRRVESQVVE